LRGSKAREEKIAVFNSKSTAEVKEKYFALVKFSTQVLKTLCKTGSRDG